MRRFLTRASRIAALLVLPMFIASAAPALTACGAGGSSCCKVCSEGKACGDTCIAKNETCRVGSGCACNQ